jgi:hypothetical protein
VLLGVGLCARVHKDVCACVMSVSDVLCNSKKSLSAQSSKMLKFVGPIFENAPRGKVACVCS